MNRSDDAAISINKIASVMPISEEGLAWESGFSRRGHTERVEPTPEQVNAHQRAVELIAEAEANPYVRISGYDVDFGVEPLETERWVHDETEEQWLQRFREWREANPDAKPEPSLLRRLMAPILSESVVARLVEGEREGES